MRVLPATAPNGQPAPGWVTVIVVPQSSDPQPQPTLELRRQVHDFLALRAPATVMPGRIAVIGPKYLPVGASVIVFPADAAAAGSVERRVESALRSFLHPVTGGPEGKGWPFGRGVYLSDLASILEALDGVDHLRNLELLLGGAPVGEQVSVPRDRIVTAGPIRILMRGE